MRLFVADTPSGDWTELTDGDQRTLRVSADLRALGRDVLRRLASRGQANAS